MILFLDTETSGLRPGQICQLSYLCQYKDGVVAKNYFFTVDYVEMGAYAVHGFSVQKLKELSNGKRFEDRLSEFDKDIRSADLIITHNTDFDFMFLREEYARSGDCFTYKDSLCSMKTSTPVCKIPKTRGVGYKYPKLVELCDFMNISEGEIDAKTIELFGTDVGFHDARFDTVATYLAVNKGMENYSEFKGLKDYL